MKVRVRVYLGGYKTDGVGVCLAVADALQRFAALPHYYLYPDTMSSSKIRKKQIFKSNQIKDRIDMVLNLVTQVVNTNRTPSHKASYQLNTVCEM